MFKRKQPTDSTNKISNSYKNKVDIKIEELVSFQNFKDNIDSKINFSLPINATGLVLSINQDKNIIIYISYYVFMVLLLYLLFLDFLHDFTDLNRKENQIYSNNKYKQEYKEILIETYKRKFEENIIYINDKIIYEGISGKTFKFSDPLNEINLRVFSQTDGRVINIPLQKFIDVTELKSESLIKQKSQKVIYYLGINEIGNKMDQIRNFKCSENLLSLINSSDITGYKNINFFIDADKSKYTMFPIVNKICEILFNRMSYYQSLKGSIKSHLLKLPKLSQYLNIDLESIILQSSIVNDYDSATTPQLEKLINSIKIKYMDYFKNYYGLLDDNDETVITELEEINKIIKNSINRTLKINLKLTIEGLTLIDLDIENRKNNLNLLINKYFSLSKNVFTENAYENFLKNPNPSKTIKKNSSLSEVTNSMKKYMYFVKEPFFNFVYSFYTVSSGTDFSVLDTSPFYNSKNLAYNIKNIKTKRKDLYDKLIKLYFPLYENIDLDTNNKDDVEKEMINVMNKIVCINRKVVFDPSTVLAKLRFLYPNAPHQLTIDFVDYWFHKDTKSKKFVFDTALNNCSYDLSKLKKVNLYLELYKSFIPIYNSKSNNIDMSLNNFMNNLAQTVHKSNDDYEEFLDNMIILTSLKKTMGDFSQILYCSSFKNEDENLNVFFSFDIICTHISSLFNLTLAENIENPLIPMKLYYPKKNIIITSVPGTFSQIIKKIKLSSFGKVNKKKDLKKKDLKKNQSSKSKTYDTLIKLCKKYHIPIDKNCYGNLKKLYLLQLKAKKLRIPITYMKVIKVINEKSSKKSQISKRFYKSIKMLEKEINKKIIKKIRK